MLKPKTGKFIFVEHVLSQTNDSLRRQQEALTPMDQSCGWLQIEQEDRRSHKEGVWQRNDYEYFDLDGFWVIGSQIAGIASM